MASPQTSSSTARPPYCSLNMNSSVSAGKRELYHRTRGKPRSSLNTKTIVKEVTATTTKAFPFLASSAKPLLVSFRSACRSWLSASTPGITVWLPSQKVYSRHGLLSPSTPGEVQRTTDSKINYVAFVDLTEAFDFVSRDDLFKALRKIGCSPKLHSLIESFYSSMKRIVQLNGSSSEPFEIRSGVKQGCVLALTLWNILRSSPQARSWLCNRGYLPANQIRR